MTWKAFLIGPKAIEMGISKKNLPFKFYLPGTERVKAFPYYKIYDRYRHINMNLS